jgi:hypothetical protein
MSVVMQINYAPGAATPKWSPERARDVALRLAALPVLQGTVDTVRDGRNLGRHVPVRDSQRPRLGDPSQARRCAQALIAGAAALSPSP